MALRETIDLDVAAARRQIKSLETALNGLSKTLQLDVEGNAKAEVETIDNKLKDAEKSAQRLAIEMTAAARSAGLAEVNVEQMARALGISETEANQLVTELLQSQAAANKTEAAARDIARQLGLAGDEADRFVNSLRRADTAAESINVRGGALVATFGGVRNAAAGIAGVLATIGIGRGIGAAVQGARTAVNEFARLNESINAVEVTFEEASDQIFNFGRISAQAAGLSAQTFQQAVVPIGAVLRNFGFDAQQAASASIELVQRAADLASVFNTDVNDALLAINSALVGQVEPLRRYGAEVSVARAEQFAFATGLARTKADLDDNILTQARLGLILQDTNRVAGDFVNTSGDFANASRVARAQFEELAARLGELLLPAFEAIVQAGPQIAAAFEGLAPVVEDIGQTVANAVPSIVAFTTALADIGQVGGPILGFLFDVQTEILQVGAVAAQTAAEVFEAITQQRPADIGSVVQFSRIIRGVSEALADGADKGDLFGEALRESVSRVNLTVDRLNTLTLATRATAAEQQKAVLALLAGRSAYGLTADEVAVLARRQAELSEELDDSGRANESYLATIQAIRAQTGQTVDATLTQADAFRILSEAAAAAGTSVADIAAGNLPELADAIALVTPATLDLATAAENLDAFAQAFNEANQNLSDEIDVFGELPDELEVSKREFLKNLTITAGEQAKFEADLLKLFQIAPALATTLQAQGLPARGLVSDFLADAFSAQRANDLLTGEAADVTGIYTNALRDELEVAGLDAAGVEALTKFMEGFASPDIIATVVALMGADIQRQLLALRFNLNASQVQLVLDAGGSDVRFRNFIPQLPAGGTGGGGGTFVQFTQNIETNYPVAKDPETSIQQGAQLAGAVGGLLTGFGT